MIVNPDTSGLDFPGGSQGPKQGGWAGRGRLHSVIHVGRTGKFHGGDHRVTGRDNNHAQRLRGAEVNLPTSNQIMDSPNTFIEPVRFFVPASRVGHIRIKGRKFGYKTTSYLLHHNETAFAI